MPERQCTGKFWVYKTPDGSVESGRDSYESADYAQLTFYDTKEARDADVDLIAFNASIDTGIINEKVEGMKSPEEYAGKAENATRWMNNNPVTDPPDDVGDYTAELYPWMSLEVNAKGCTPRECANDIISAMNRNGQGLARAQERIAIREQARST